MEKIESGHYYHIYNRGNNKQNIFFEEENYIYFRKLLEKHISPIAKVYSYCLLSNHFHLLIKFNDNLTKPSQGLSNLMNAYTKAINKRFNRTGSLFEKPFKRIRIANENYLLNLVLYIHLNPEHHKLVENFEDYKHSSYLEIMYNNTSLIDAKSVVELFNDRKNFIDTHLLRKVYLTNKNSTFE